MRCGKGESRWSLRPRLRRGIRRARDGSPTVPCFEPIAARYCPAMARSDLMGRLADLSEEAMQRLSEAPGADRVMGTVNTLKDRLDELQRRVRGLEELEKRLEELEGRVDKLTGEKTTSSSSGGSTKPASTKSSGSSTKKS